MGMQLIETIEVGAGGASSIEFTGIPQDGVDLVLVYSLRHDSSSDLAGRIILNGDTTAANYSEIWLLGDNGGVTSASYSANYLGYSNPDDYTANTFNSGQVVLSNYTSSSAKTFGTEVVTENNASAAQALLIAGKWSGISAITSIEITPNTANYKQYSTASLYKITAD